MSEFFPFAATTVGSTTRYTEQTGYADHEYFYMLSQYLHGEAFAVSVAQRLLQTPGIPANLFDGIERLHADECRHVELIANYMQRKGRQPHHVAPKIEASVGRSLAHDHPFLPLLMLNVVVESFGIGSINLLLRNTFDNEIKDILQEISQDEARHVRIAPNIKDWLGLDFNNAANWIIAGCAGMRESTCDLNLLSQYWGTEQVDDIYNDALTSPMVKRQARNVFAVLMRTVRRIPQLNSALGSCTALFAKPFSEVEVH